MAKNGYFVEPNFAFQFSKRSKNAENG